jgi:hypothetical protein
MNIGRRASQLHLPYGVVRCRHTEHVRPSGMTRHGLTTDRVSFDDRGLLDRPRVIAGFVARINPTA